MKSFIACSAKEGHESKNIGHCPMVLRLVSLIPISLEHSITLPIGNEGKSLNRLHLVTSLS